MNLRTESDPKHLRKIAILLEDENKRLLEVIQWQADRLQKWEGTGDEVQQALNLIEAKRPKPEVESPKPSPKKPRKKRTKFGPNDQPDLSREQHTFALPEDEHKCPECGEDLRAEPALDDVSELITVIDVKYVVTENTQRKYRCGKCKCLCRAPGPERAVRGGRYGIDLGVKVAIDKYQHHIPLARQSRIMAEHGLHAPRNSLYTVIERMADELKLTWQAIINNILRADVIGLDQTGWPNLDYKGKKWQVWCLTAPNLVAHIIRGDKSAKTFNDIVGDYGGVIVCDALSSHLSAVKSRAGPYILAGCWAHVRRKFTEAEPDFPEARVALMRIRELYDIEQRAESDEERAHLRSTESAAVLKQLFGWLTTTRMPKTTRLGAAIRYTLRDWDRLGVFVNKVTVPLDNNRTERGIRGLAIGRRVHFGSKSRHGTQVAAIYYTLVESAKLAGINPTAYIREALIAARRGIALTPAGYTAYLAQHATTVGEPDST